MPVHCVPFVPQGNQGKLALRKKMTKTIHVGGRPVWAEISLKAILRNLAIIRKHVNSVGPLVHQGKHSAHGDHSHERLILAVVKSNAYGLGAVPISKALQKAGTEWFGVTCANEGIELRESWDPETDSGADWILAGRRKASAGKLSDADGDARG